MIKFTNATIYRNSDANEILVKDGVIQQIGKGLPAATEEIDLKGRLVVPPYVDSHLHLDYVYTGAAAVMRRKMLQVRYLKGLRAGMMSKKRNLLKMPKRGC